LRGSTRHPERAYALAGALGAAALTVGAGWVLALGGASAFTPVTATGLVGAAALAGAAPIAVVHETRVRHVRRVEAAVPEVLNRLAGFNERGIGLVRALRIVAKTGAGALVREVRRLNRDIAWNGSVRNAMHRLRTRVPTPRVTRLAALLSHASAATGNLRDVLEIAAHDASRVETLRARKKQSMLVYVIVIYVVFAVFLYTLHVTGTLFVGDAAFAAADDNSLAIAAGGANPERVRVFFLHAVLTQAVASGFVAGKIGEGHVLSGVKHAAFLGLIAWFVFAGVAA
jgi:flagellar protein FlaJ